MCHKNLFEKSNGLQKGKNTTTNGPDYFLQRSALGTLVNLSRNFREISLTSCQCLLSLLAAAKRVCKGERKKRKGEGEGKRGEGREGREGKEERERGD